MLEGRDSLALGSFDNTALKYLAFAIKFTMWITTFKQTITLWIEINYLLGLSYGLHRVVAEFATANIRLGVCYKTPSLCRHWRLRVKCYQDF